jgi:hypothetical protein
MLLQLQIHKIQVLRRGGTDKIDFVVEDCPSPFPDMEAKDPGKYPAAFSVETQSGKAEEWLSKLGFDRKDYELVEVPKYEYKFVDGG